MDIRTACDKSASFHVGFIDGVQTKNKGVDSVDVYCDSSF